MGGGGDRGDPAGSDRPWQSRRPALVAALLKRKATKTSGGGARQQELTRIAWKLMTTGEVYDGAPMLAHRMSRLKRSAGRRVRRTG